MDILDKKIIQLLQEDARLSSREIAKKLHSNTSTIYSRVKKLIDEHIISQFTIMLNHQKLGNDLVVFILVKTQGKIPNHMFKEPVKEVFGITGQYDLIVKCRFKNMRQFNEFIITFRDLPQVKETVTLMGTIEIKEAL